MSIDTNLIGQRFARNSAQPPNLSEEGKTELSAVLEKISNKTYVFEERHCAVCDGEYFESLSEHDRYGIPIQTTICRGCGLIQTNPDMREVDYVDFYTHHYRKLYITELVGEPIKFFQEEYWRGQRIVRYITKNVDLPVGALVVEIGCGAGGILHAFADRGYRVIGTDLGIDNMTYGRRKGLDLRTGDLFDLRLTETPALIIYSHVLEHIREPGQTIQRVREILGNTGYLYVEVPGIKEVHKNLFQADFLKMFHLAHIYNFSLLTLSNLLRKHGMRCLVGDESIRSLFKFDQPASEFQSDYSGAMTYIEKTENRRGLYRAIFKFKSAFFGSFYVLRRIAINTLRRAGLYDFVKRITT